MAITKEQPIKSTFKASKHPYLSGAWTPNLEQLTATDMEVIGTIPSDIDGVYVRNTENPVHEPLGNYHPFDGDAMIHAISFKEGKAEYRNRFVRTDGFLAEQEAGTALWPGIANSVTEESRPGWGAHGYIKDSSSTDVVLHAGNIMSSFWQCGEGYLLDPYTLEHKGKKEWVPDEGISAHAKVDENTGELLFFNYSKKPPYQHYGVVDKDNKLIHYTPIPLSGPRLSHDMAFSQHYSIFADLPMSWVHHPTYHPELPTRFAIIPRYGSEQDIQWFEADPTYVLHWMNAYEEGDEVVLEGYFQENPNPAPLPDMPPALGKLMANVDLCSLQSKLHRWRFNLKTGAVKEHHLDDRVLEFGSFNQKYAGIKNRYNYSVWNKPGWFLFSGLVKHDYDTGESWSFAFGDERYGSEAPFVPRINAQAEDDGYLVSFITDMNENRSECILVDAQHIEQGPVCRIILPHRISSGTHACWANGDDIPAFTS